MANKRSSLNLEQRSPQLLHQQHILLAMLTLLDVCRAVYLREVTFFFLLHPQPRNVKNIYIFYYD